MFKKILVPTDGSPLAEKAVDAALELARQVNGRIVAISVAEKVSMANLAEGGAIIGDLQVYEQRARKVADEHLQRVRDRAALANVPCETLVPYSTSPDEEIVAAAEKSGCDAIFMASHGRRGINRLLLGSVTQKVLAHTTLPVTVFR